MKLAYPQSRELQIDVLESKTAFPIYGTFKNGVIKRAMGLAPMHNPPINNLVCAHITATGDGLAYMKDRMVYKIANGDFTKLMRFNTLVADSPFFVEMQTDKGTDVLLGGNKTSVLLRNGACGFAPGFPPSACAAVRCGRVFAADFETGYILRWSGEDDILNWKRDISGAGYLYVDTRGGKIKRLFDFGGELVALRENGITRLAVNGTPESYRVTENIILTGAILPQTAAVAGDRLFFICENEALYFKDGKVRKLDCWLFDDAEEYGFATAAMGRYYVLKAYSKKLKRNVVYLYDVLLETGYVLDLEALSVHEDKSSLVFDSYLQSFRLEVYDDYEIDLGTFDFGTSKRKLLTEIYAECDNDVTVTVGEGKATRKYAAGGSVKPGIRGSAFTVKVSGKGEVRALKLKAEVRK